MRPKVNRTFVLICIAMLVLAASPPDIESGRPGIDVEQYRFEISLSDSTNEIHGQATVTVRFTGAIESYYLDFVGRSRGNTGMSVRSVQSNGIDVPFEHADDRLNIMPGDVTIGNRQTYTIDYAGIAGDGLIISTNKFGERTFFADNWPNRARHWLPTVDHVSDKALVDWVVTAPMHYQVIANGALVDDAQAVDGRRTTHWRSVAPISTKVMVIGVARFAIDDLDEVDGVPIQTWVYPEDRENGFHDFAVGPAIMRYFIGQIGTYPYAKLAQVQSTTRYGGMENASAIFYPENAVTGRRTNEATIAHEIAHQWFGDSVTEKDWHHIWLSEGFATYFTELFWEQAYGRDEMEQRLKRNRQTVINYYLSRPDQPLVDTRITDPNALLNPNAYQKGEWVLHMLRNEIGTENFWAGIRVFYQRFRDSNALTEDLQDVMEEVSGQDLDEFFQQWVYRPGQPHIEGNWRYDPATGIVQIDLEQLQPDLFSFPLEIGITTTSGTLMVKRVEMTGLSHTFAFELDEAPRVIELDPNTNLLFTGELDQ